MSKILVVDIEKCSGCRISITEITFYDCLLLWNKDYRTKRTGLSAHLTPDTLLILYLNSIRLRIAVQGLCGTDPDAGRLLALSADYRDATALGIILKDIYPSQNRNNPFLLIEDTSQFAEPTP